TMPRGTLDALTGRLAAGLRQRHRIGPGDIVGVLIERSGAMVVAIQGVIKAGAAYLPLDPTDPDARIDGLLADAGCRVLLLTPATDRRLAFTGTRLDVSAADAFAADPSAGWEVGPADLAYVIYTSGS